MVTICYTTSILQYLISTLYSLGKPASGVCPLVFGGMSSVVALEGLCPHDMWLPSVCCAEV